MGKITVIKNYALPKLIYALSFLPNPPTQTVKRIEKLMYNFIWDGKPEKKLKYMYSQWDMKA